MLGSVFNAPLPFSTFDISLGIRVRDHMNTVLVAPISSNSRPSGNAEHMPIKKSA